MTGKDVFAALNFVDDELIAEAAEAHTLRRVIPMHTLRWVGTLAACICVLVGWAFAANWSSATADNMMIGGENSTTAAAEDTRESADMAEGGAVPESAGGTDNGASVGQDAYGGTIIAHNPDQAAETVCYPAPEDGEWLCADDVQEMAERNPDARFLVTFRLFRNSEEITDFEDEAYSGEWERLSALGYDCRRLPVETESGTSWHICVLLTAEQLNQFAAPEDYGYFFQFLPDNADGTETSWDDPRGETISVLVN